MQVTLRWICDGSEIKPGNDIENSRIVEIVSTFSHHLQSTSNHLPSQRENWTGVTARGEFLTWLQIHLQRSWSVQVWRDCRRKLLPDSAIDSGNFPSTQVTSITVFSIRWTISYKKITSASYIVLNAKRSDFTTEEGKRSGKQKGVASWMIFQSKFLFRLGMRKIG